MFKTQEAEQRVSQVNDIQVIKFPGDNEDEDEKLLSITKSTTTHSSNSNGKDTTSNTNSSPSVQSDLTEDEWVNACIWSSASFANYIETEILPS